MSSVYPDFHELQGGEPSVDPTFEELLDAGRTTGCAIIGDPMGAIDAMLEKIEEAISKLLGGDDR